MIRKLWGLGARWVLAVGIGVAGGAALAGAEDAPKAAGPAPENGVAVTAGKAVSLPASIPFVLEHNRMILEGALERPDGSLRTAAVWVDTGNPDLMMSEALARDLGIDLDDAASKAKDGWLEVPAPPALRLGGVPVPLQGVTARVALGSPMMPGLRAEINLPSTVMRRYRVVFDYPARRLVLAEPGKNEPQGNPVTAKVHPVTGVVQVEVDIEGQKASFALDNGASYTFVSQDWLAEALAAHRDWPHRTGALGCANMWGWQTEAKWPLARVPAITCGKARLPGVGVAGLPKAVFEWYSRKTAEPVTGLLGPNAFRGCRVEIDFERQIVHIPTTSLAIICPRFSSDAKGMNGGFAPAPIEPNGVSSCMSIS
ncbi:MAG: aspartyl protease family protein [Acidobacteria bacterium]|nr:aspartyl protease family protein [Acidobacteriota bacterium]